METESALCKADSIIHERIPDIRPALLRSPVQCVSTGRQREHPVRLVGKSFCPSSRGLPLPRSERISFSFQPAVFPVQELQPSFAYVPWYSSPLSRLCGILALSGYRKRTLHFRLLPMVKCPLDCFLVYSFLLDVELAKIRHAPFGIFAFSDKPLRNPSEHSGFWYIQGRIFSSCGLSETQRLSRSLVRFRAHRGDRSRKAHKWLYFPL